MSAHCDLSQAQVVGETRWLRLESLKYHDEAGVERVWDRCVRPHKASEQDADAVLVITTLKGTEKDEIVLVKQFRPAVACYVLEFPAGLVDSGETEEEAAVRELKEECGFVGLAIGKSRPLPLSPGMTNEKCTAVTVEVDMSLPENKNPVKKLEDGEFCEVVRIEKSRLLEELNRHASNGVQVACDLFCLAQGMAIAQAAA